MLSILRQCRGFSSLVISEHVGGSLSSSTLSAISAAKTIGATPIHVLVAGSPDQTGAVSESVSSLDGVDCVLVASHEAYSHQLAENLTQLICGIQEKNKYTHIVAPGTTFGKDVTPRLAATMDVAAISDVISIESQDTFSRPVYAGNAISTVTSSDSVKILTVRPTAFPAVGAFSSRAKIENAELPSSPETGMTNWIKEEISKSDRPELASAKIVVAGGRAFKSKENFDMLYKLADLLQAAVGASRAAVDAGYCQNDLQVGQTGKVVAPELYIAFGISGAIQHVAGMKDSKVIVAINKDKDAPIFQIADFGLVGDLFKIIPEMEAALLK
uniref:Electron transfer flavoprotein subunit alpha n=1 Tax=Spongospora subterranea TaxID=70186 RepID=A0A0H5R6Y4_9EUKA|eukprot:CRZ09591.1 hypothetical protein [Spongospora subterranea]